MYNRKGEKSTLVPVPNSYPSYNAYLYTLSIMTFGFVGNERDYYNPNNNLTELIEVLYQLFAFMSLCVVALSFVASFTASRSKQA
jgi:hypothetical protein